MLLGEDAGGRLNTQDEDEHLIASPPGPAPSEVAASPDRQPGRELDALVAEVLGMVVTRDWPCYREPECGELMAALEVEPEFPGRYDEPGPVWRDDRTNYQEPVPEYSTDIRDAWRVVEQLHAEGWYIAVFDYPDALSVSVTCPHGPCRKHGGQRHSIRQWHGAEGVRGLTMPHAICLAALEALTPETHDNQTEQTER